jgi:hypothetical protein
MLLKLLGMFIMTAIVVSLAAATWRQDERGGRGPRR